MMSNKMEEQQEVIPQDEVPDLPSHEDQGLPCEPPPGLNCSLICILLSK